MADTSRSPHSPCSVRWCLRLIGFVVSLVLVAAHTTIAQEAEIAKPGPKVLAVRKIWDEGKHNAFTDLIRFRDAWYCTFREGDGHVGGDGTIRVLRSGDGSNWASVANIAEPGIDLRDPKFSIMPDGKLMIVAGGSVYKGGKTLLSRQPRVMISYEGSNWSAPQRVLGEGDWLWRVTWHKDTAWGISYIPQARVQPAAKAAADKGDVIEPGPADWKLKLVKSTNGFDWEVVKYLEVPGFANESTIRFLPDDTMVAFVRREAGNKFGWIGTARPPYENWNWTETKHRVGGPNFIVLEDGSMIAGSREHTPQGSRTALGRMTTSDYAPDLLLPSGGDNSYPGLVHHDGKLWVSYYSSHEGKTSIYLAEVEWPKSKP